MRIVALFAILLALAGCAAAPTGTQATDDQIAASAYRAPGAATLTLITMINNTSGSGAHTALMINGSQRVIFDPAGSFRNDRVPRRADVLYGISPAVLAAYKGAHSRAAFHMVLQTVEVTPAQAETALRLAIARGSVASAQCAASTTALLAQVQGFESVKSTWFPKKLMEQMEQYPGVKTERYYEDDDGTILDGIAKVAL
ncbi:hypothetical protein [Pseudosulfitobacter sp. SM2401]|uniref:hypothetical protein n=1 Tax=Pseudosulfitobacter sp. SM2401 TaxID=3350098 RepID=UPI0036F2D3C3